MRALLPLILTALLGTASAANVPEILQAGFSPDGRHHLLLTAYVQDGSGLPTATLQVTDVRANTILLRAELTTREGASARTVAQQLMTAQRAALTRYGLTRPLTGRRLFLKTFRAPVPWPQPQALETLTAAGWTLALRTYPVPNACDDRAGRGLLPATLTPSGLSLRVNGVDLQHDARLPRSRACAAQYRLETAWVYGRNLAVVVRAYTPGFEGPDVTPLVITGRR
ncbi:DUF2259 domain-containing protein [Deinococcus maricopensis]|uniref:DUF2259 domain-containing protein n=1 Tax=Deinococcus maricopensis (strain DSM 21211 / LMG 22137 / NRRL B-23946 / LB-34) TaxID=709986 RepID=E8U6S4_DEIML|nr:DUF2259 domain-containing protein [Deinococcus maricopensis]ADV66763.1 Protein of unknown function DUF2259, secreted [Deinococcus maricopensis DSM 21211]